MTQNRMKELIKIASNLAKLHGVKFLGFANDQTNQRFDLVGEKNITVARITYEGMFYCVK